MSDYEPDVATAHEDMCRFLSACFYEPAPEFAEEKLFDSMLAAAKQIDPVLAESARKLGEAFAAEDLQTLLVDYTRLFLGPLQVRAQPYGSCWMDAREQSSDNQSHAVLELYNAGGLELDDEFRELPDHVAIELEFLYLLAFARNEAQRAGNESELKTAEQLERQFLSEHLGAWIGPFSAAVRSGAETQFYRELAGMTERFVRLREASVGAVN